MMPSKNSITRFPIKVILCYLFATVALYAFGPIEYVTNHPILLYFYLLLSFLLLYWGYLSGVQSASRLGIDSSENANRDTEIAGVPLRWYTLMLILSLVLLHLTLYARSGSFFFDISAFSNLNDAYIQRYELVISRGRSYIEWLRIILSPITLAYFPVGIICWKKLRWLQRCLFVYLVAGNALSDLVTGTNKSFADTIIYLAVYIVLALIYAGQQFELTTQLKRFKTKMHGVGRILIVLGLIFLVVFTMNISSRLQKKTSTLSNTLEYITLYCTQGYKAVDFTFDQPFESTFGLGSSMYILRSTPIWFQTDYFENRTYLQKNESRFGWNQRVKWSSIYVWIGNDVSIWGALAVIFIIGRFFGKVWIDAIRKKEISAIVLTAIMVQLCFYIPANNQVVQTTEALAGLLFFIVMRMVVKSRENAANKRLIIPEGRDIKNEFQGGLQ